MATRGRRTSGARSPRATGKPVDEVMPTFVDQPGVPLVSVSLGCERVDAARRRSRRRAYTPIAGTSRDLDAALAASGLPADLPSGTTDVRVCSTTEQATLQLTLARRGRCRTPAAAATTGRALPPAPCMPVGRRLPSFRRPSGWRCWRTSGRSCARGRHDVGSLSRSCVRLRFRAQGAGARRLRGLLRGIDAE